jgi:hypothetical protein
MGLPEVQMFSFVLFVLGVNQKFKTPAKWGFLALRPDLEEALG